MLRSFVKVVGTSIFGGLVAMTVFVLMNPFHNSNRLYAITFSYIGVAWIMFLVDAMMNSMALLPYHFRATKELMGWWFWIKKLIHRALPTFFLICAASIGVLLLLQNHFRWKLQGFTVVTFTSVYAGLANTETTEHHDKSSNHISIKQSCCNKLISVLKTEGIFLLFANVAVLYVIVGTTVRYMIHQSLGTIGKLLYLEW